MTAEQTPAGALSPTSRLLGLDELRSRTEPLDVLVIGGGVTGAGVALDAASRGLSVALVEAHDLAFGTSRWSSKLVHGGLRYLASLGVGIARESAVERHRIMTVIAPHLVHALPQVIPVFQDSSMKSSIAARLGMMAGDVLRYNAKTPSEVLARSRRVSASEAEALCPGIKTEGLRGAVVAHDGQLIDDARFVVAMARTAAIHGAIICTHTRATGVTGDGATLTDVLNGGSFGVRARAVVNATGVWAGEVDRAVKLRPSRGTHLVVDSASLGNPTGALTVPLGDSISRYVFALPQQLGRTYIGLTDVDAPGPIPDEPQPSDDEITLLLGTINKALARPLTTDDIRGVFAGLRPLVEEVGPGVTMSTADLSRKHLVAVGDSGLITVVGGKLTTYRQMAEEAVDEAVSRSGLRSDPCHTSALSLIGATGTPAASGAPSSLIARFGAEAPHVMDVAQVSDPAAQIAPGIDVTRAEIEFAITHEGACTVDDILSRRTRIALVQEDADLARDAVTDIASEYGFGRGPVAHPA
jgi:glycerol-3-phosphate dehydrogenase